MRFTTVYFATLFTGMSFGQTPGTAELLLPNGSIYNGTGAIAVELWITFGSQAYAWATWKGDVSGSDAFAKWTTISSPSPLILASPGNPSAGVVHDVSVAQLHFPPIFYANTANPIKIWSAEWSTSDLTPRVVTLTPDTQAASVYIPGGENFVLVLDDLQANIQVIPAPSSFAFLALSGGLAFRRRRARMEGWV